MIPADDVRTCGWCRGDFLPEDMDGEHCRECAADLFAGSGSTIADSDGDDGA